MTDVDPALGYLALPWSWRITQDAETGDYLAVVGEFPDFFAAGATPGEAAARARDALLSHIRGYLATDTRIPTPPATTGSTASSGVQARELSEIAA